MTNDINTDVNNYITELAKPNNDTTAKKLYKELLDVYGVDKFLREFDNQLQELRG